MSDGSGKTITPAATVNTTCNYYNTRGLASDTDMSGLFHVEWVEGPEWWIWRKNIQQLSH